MTSWGILGAGSIGGSLARDLLAAGESVLVCDPRERAVASLADRGALVAGSLGELARRCEIVACCVPEVRAPAATAALLEAGPGCLVVETARLKGRVVRHLQGQGLGHDLGRRCFPARPLVESASGWRRARTGLFDEELFAFALEPGWELDPGALDHAFELLRICRARAVFATAKQLDEAAARYEQLPLLLASGRAERAREDPLEGLLSGPAYRELTGGAARAPGDAAEALLGNGELLESELDRLIREAGEWRELVSRRDLRGLRQRLERGEFARARLGAVRWQKRPRQEITVPATAAALLEVRGPVRALDREGERLHLTIG